LEDIPPQQEGIGSNFPKLKFLINKKDEETYQNSQFRLKKSHKLGPPKWEGKEKNSNFMLLTT